MDDTAAVRGLLDDRPDLEAAIADVLAVDDEQVTWTFEDIPVDSGAFGELVSEGVVEKVDGEYRVAAPEAVRAALAEGGDGISTGADGTVTPSARIWPQVGGLGVVFSSQSRL